MKTKERILIESLRLFAKEGYEGVSVQDIADKVYITKGALYRHYKNKRDIFDSIVDTMTAKKKERDKEYALDENIFESRKIAGVTPMEHMVRYVGEEFRYWTKDEFAANFRRMLTIEQYRDWEMSYLYQDYLTKGVLKLIENYFSVMMMENVMRTRDPKALARELYAPVYMMITMYDLASDKREIVQHVRQHLEKYLVRF